MRRSPRFGATQRKRKVRNPITVRQRVTKKGGRCAGCRQRYEIGDNVTVVKVKRRVFHTASCVPPNIDQIGTIIGQQNTGAPVTMPKTHGEAAMDAMVRLENALVLRAKAVGITDEMEKIFDRYQKLKGMALRPGSDNEGRMAMVQSLIALVKLVFA